VTHIQNLKYTNLSWSNAEQQGTPATDITTQLLNTQLANFREKTNKNIFSTTNSYTTLKSYTQQICLLNPILEQDTIHTVTLADH
jgi:hypothetical protein